MGAVGDDALQGELIGQVAARLDALVSRAERERARRSGADAEWLEELLDGLRPLAQGMHDLELVRTIRDTVVLHGAGPWPEKDLAAITGADLARLRRVLDSLTAVGLAWPDETGS